MPEFSHLQQALAPPQLRKQPQTFDGQIDGAVDAVVDELDVACSAEFLDVKMSEEADIIENKLDFARSSLSESP